jgi:hypothetical protein
MYTKMWWFEATDKVYSIVVHILENSILYEQILF